MSGTQELAVREKQELAKQDEKTIPGRYFIPNADIFETEDAMMVILEMPGVEKKDISIALEEDVLRVEGQIDYSKYQGMQPVYTEYNIGHYARRFSLSDKIDRDSISAQLENGVLALTLPKSKEAKSRRISII
jgi:HSP20 family molecular chaperone IbpA